MQKVKCPVCNSDIVVEEEIYEGDIVECAVCNSISEITALHPLNVNLLEDHSDEKEEDDEE